MQVLDLIFEPLHSGPHTQQISTQKFGPTEKLACI
jgi:hypothetical protein